MTILAATAQTARSAIQKRMKPLLGDMGATYIRFSYALPFAWLWVISYGGFSGHDVPQVTTSFWGWVSFAAMMQVVFTIFLIKMFSHRSFAAGTAFSKTEVLQAAIFEALILGVVVSFITGIAIFLGVIAVVMLSLAQASLSRHQLHAALFSRQTLLGLMSGATLGLATVCFKAAVLAVDSDDWLMAAAYTGAIAVTLQTVVMGSWMALSSHRNQLKATLLNWRSSLFAGLFGAVATAAWFTAFALYAVAPVRAVGQVELLITIGVSIFYFREKTNKAELLAIILLLLSIVMIVIDT